MTILRSSRKREAFFIGFGVVGGIVFYETEMGNLEWAIHWLSALGEQALPGFWQSRVVYPHSGVAQLQRARALNLVVRGAHRSAQGTAELQT